jgi:uncharacterized protein YjbJ (UPF0337 family)
MRGRAAAAQEVAASLNISQSASFGVRIVPAPVSRIVQNSNNREVYAMDKDRVAGSAKQIKGKIKSAVGAAVGDAELQAEGQADQAAGKAQNLVGTVKDSVRSIEKSLKS